MDIGIAVHHTTCDGGAGIGGLLRSGANALQCPLHEQAIAYEPDCERQHQAHIGPIEQDRRAHDIGDRICESVKDLKHRLTCGGRRLHDTIGNPACEIVFKPADGLAQHVIVRAPAHQCTKIGQDGIVEQQHIQKLDCGTDE